MEENINNEEEYPEKKKSRKKLVIGIIIGVIIVIGIIVIPNNNPNNGDSINNIPIPQNCREIQVPYEEVEQYYEQEPYQEVEYYNKYLEGQLISRDSKRKIDLFSSLGEYAYSEFELKNIDNEPGWFTVTFYWETLQDESQEKVRHYINPDEIIKFESEYDIDMGEDFQVAHYFISDPIEIEKIVTKYRDVLKERTITKYRTEEVCE